MNFFNKIPYSTLTFFEIKICFYIARESQMSKSSLFLGLGISVLIATTCLAQTIPDRSGYWYDLGKYNSFNGSLTKHQNWMGRLANSQRITDISIPGTHDTMAYKGFSLATDRWARCQTMDLITQLNAGIRFLDIRGRRVKNKDGSFAYAMHHGIEYLDSNLDDVLSTLQNWLKTHPTEIVVVGFNGDNYKPNFEEPTNADPLPDRTPAAIFDKYRKKYTNLFWKVDNKSVPTIGQLRGKVLLLEAMNYFKSDYKNFPDLDTWGIPFEDRGNGVVTLSFQNMWELTRSQLYSKWLEVKNHIDLAWQGRSGVFYINFLSAAGTGVTPAPFFVASGQEWLPQNGMPLTINEWKLVSNGGQTWDKDWPRKCSLGVCEIYTLGMNPLTANYLPTKTGKGKGIILSDFPGAPLIENTIEANFK